jgi:hypothetical protein
LGEEGVLRGQLFQKLFLLLNVLKLLPHYKMQQISIFKNQFRSFFNESLENPAEFFLDRYQDWMLIFC